MALCVVVDGVGQLVQAGQQNPCDGYALVSAAEYERFVGLGDLWSPDYGFAGWVLGSALLMFAVGAGIGLVLQQVRKIRSV